MLSIYQCMLSAVLYVRQLCLPSIQYVCLNTKTRNFYIWQLLLYLLLKLTQIYSAAAWSWIVQHIFQIILFNFVSSDLYRFCKLDILLKIALKHSTGTQNHVSKSNQIRLEGSLVLMQYGISQTFLVLKMYTLIL